MSSNGRTPIVALLTAAIDGTCAAFRGRPRANGIALIALLLLRTLLWIDRAGGPRWHQLGGQQYGEH